MDYNVSFLCGDVVIVGGEVECFVLEVLADGWIELFDVETDEAELWFVYDRFEPVDFAVVFFHWLMLCFFAIVLLMRLKLFLLILPISDLVGLMSR